MPTVSSQPSISHAPTTASDSSSSSSSLSVGAIVGIVVGIVAAIGIAIGIYFYVKRQQTGTYSKQPLSTFERFDEDEDL